jgi:tetratricopeptide (TPR) repeat protein
MAGFAQVIFGDQVEFVIPWHLSPGRSTELLRLLLNQTAYYLHERGQYAEAEPLLKQAMAIRRTALGEQHPAYATSLNNLAGLYDAMGRHAEAEPLYQQAMEIYRTALGERHPDYAGSLHNLAVLYQETGRHAEAEPLLEQADQIIRSTMRTLSNSICTQSHIIFDTVD